MQIVDIELIAQKHRIWRSPVAYLITFRTPGRKAHF